MLQSQGLMPAYLAHVTQSEGLMPQGLDLSGLVGLSGLVWEEISGLV